MAEQEVLNTLTGVANESQQIREEAEKRLSQYSLQPGYGAILIRIMSNGEIPVHFRQVSTLSVQVQGQWLILSLTRNLLVLTFPEVVWNYSQTAYSRAVA